MLKIRERYNRSIVDEIKASMAIDGYSINSDQQKPRALSQLRTYNNYGSVSNTPSKLELTSLLTKKTNGGGTKTPVSKRGLINELPWED